MPLTCAGAVCVPLGGCHCKLMCLICAMHGTNVEVLAADGFCTVFKPQALHPVTFMLVRVSQSRRWRPEVVNDGLLLQQPLWQMQCTPWRQ